MVVVSTHALVAVPDHMVTRMLWFGPMLPVLYMFKPSGTITSPTCGEALRPMKVESLGKKNDPSLIWTLGLPTASAFQ